MFYESILEADEDYVCTMLPEKYCEEKDTHEKNGD